MRGKRARTCFLQRGNVIRAPCSEGCLSVGIFLFPEDSIRGTGHEVVLGSRWGHRMGEGKAGNAGGEYPELFIFYGSADLENQNTRGPRPKSRIPGIRRL